MSCYRIEFKGGGSMKQLPDKPSELIRVALQDLEAVENDSRYSVDMDVWHEPDTYTTCYVCLAGSVIAKSLGAPATHSQNPDHYPYSVERKLRALDWLRAGFIKEFLECLRCPLPESLPDETDYIYYGENFKEALLDISAILEAEGL